MESWNVKARRGLWDCLMQCSLLPQRRKQSPKRKLDLPKVRQLSVGKPWVKAIFTLAFMRFEKLTGSWEKIRTANGLSVSLFHF
jgi:hypothetical protein